MLLEDKRRFLYLLNIVADCKDPLYDGTNDDDDERKHVILNILKPGVREKGIDYLHMWFRNYCSDIDLLPTETECKEDFIRIFLNFEQEEHMRVYGHTFMVMHIKKDELSPEEYSKIYDVFSSLCESTLSSEEVD